MTWEIVPGSGDGPRGPNGFGASSVRGPWWVLVVIGVIVCIAGAGLLVWPWVTATWMLAILLGAAISANGLALLVRRGRRGSAGTTIAGLLLLVLGVVIIVFAEASVAILVTFMGMLFAFLGGVTLIAVLTMGGHTRPVLWLPPALILIAGVAATIWPGVALVFVAVIAGFFTLLIGLTLIWSGARLRQLGQRR